MFKILIISAVAWDIISASTSSADCFWWKSLKKQQIKRRLVSWKTLMPNSQKLPGRWDTHWSRELRRWNREIRKYDFSVSLSGRLFFFPSTSFPPAPYPSLTLSWVELGGLPKGLLAYQEIGRGWWLLEIDTQTGLLNWGCWLGCITHARNLPLFILPLISQSLVCSDIYLKFPFFVAEVCFSS